ncbi:MAG: RluA family pseudouridine synthase [Clostridia bacterium]|nr:RluA family pseudouridine synthase [Clostridia bacterium]
MLRLICEEETTLKEFTENNYAQASLYWTMLLKNKDIKVNGKKIGQNVQLTVGDEVCYYLTDKQVQKPVFSVVYEDENVVVIDKSSGVNSEAIYAALRREKGNTCGFIHRLDRNTKGLMVFSLNERAEKELLSAFKERTAEKIYHALCFGSPQSNSGILTAYLKKDSEKAKVQIFDHPKERAEKIITEYSVMERFGERSKLKILLHTGKTHQIRAHLAHIGCPVVGDMKYGSEAKNKAFHASRQQLVAYSLRFFDLEFLSYLNGKIFCSNFDVETE